jgi:hypothetical protein
MRRISLFALATAFAIPLLATAPAHAQSRTWVSGVGDDLNPCSRTAPCKTYAGAISKTSAAGEINCLDPGGFGAVTITKSISIVCDYTEGGVLAAATTGFLINAPSGSIVTLKGQDVECFISGIHGVRMINVGVTLHVHKSQIRNCRGGSNGMSITPSSGVAKVFVDDSFITDNGTTVGTAGILVRPTAGASVNLAVNRVRLEGNANGIFADGSGGGGASNISVSESVLSASANNGIAVSSTGAAFKALVTNSVINFNVITGAAVAGSGGTLLLEGNKIMGNVTGVSNTGGTLQSFKNNVVAANGTDGTPMTAFPGPGGQPLQ